MADEHPDQRAGAVGRLYRRSGLRRVARRQRWALTYHAVVAALGPVRAASLARGLAFADRAADLTYAALPGVRRLASRHLAIALGETCPPAARAAIARQAYRNLLRCAVELAKLDEIRARFDDYVSVDGWEHLEAVRAMDTGAIVVTGHIGNCDLLAAYMAHRGLALTAVARRLDDARLNRLLIEFRTGYGLGIILRGDPGAGRAILNVLNRRGVLVMQIDMDVRVPSVSVPFFGRLARTPLAPALLAARRRIPTVPAFARRRPQGGHHLTIMPPIMPPDSGDRHADVVALTSQLNRVVEDFIRRYPAEWNWWHRRWRRPPVPKLDPDAPRPALAASA